MSAPTDPDGLERFHDWQKPKTKLDVDRTETGFDPGGSDDASAVEPFPAATNPVGLSPIVITCPNCSGVLHASGDSGGKRGRCPTCGNVLLIPETATRSVAPALKLIDLRSKPRPEFELHPEPVRPKDSLLSGAPGWKGAPNSRPLPPSNMDPASPTSTQTTPVSPTPQPQSTASPPPASSQPAEGWDIEKSVTRFFTEMHPAILIPLLLMVAGFIFYRCLGGPPAPTTKPETRHFREVL